MRVKRRIERRDKVEMEGEVGKGVGRKEKEGGGEEEEER